jgi:hypothetical protein
MMNETTLKNSGPILAELRAIIYFAYFQYMMYIHREAERHN